MKNLIESKIQMYSFRLTKLHCEDRHDEFNELLVSLCNDYDILISIKNDNLYSITNI